MAVEIRCLACNLPVQETDDACPHCGARRLAPPCPNCGRPVSDERNRIVVQPGYIDQALPWSHRWNQVCVACGHKFESTILVRTGHPAFLAYKPLDPPIHHADGPESLDVSDRFGQGLSEITIRGYETDAMKFDAWDYRPVISIVIRREAGGHGPNGTQLAQEASIVLTEDEIAAIWEQLNGPLAILGQRKPWQEDTT